MEQGSGGRVSCCKCDFSTSVSVEKYLVFSGYYQCQCRFGAANTRRLTTFNSVSCVVIGAPVKVSDGCSACLSLLISGWCGRCELSASAMVAEVFTVLSNRDLKLPRPSPLTIYTHKHLAAQSMADSYFPKNGRLA